MTVQGAKLTVSIMDGKVYLTDAKGGKVMVEAADVKADNAPSRLNSFGSYASGLACMLV
ncbi:hypothetical protein IPL68_06075 [Candidatus Saccharibacteria bacterium]|nr:MAG: hypothetical protein IPL68_06075 [Candidatus Saccharibacteria bacterium]